MVKKDRHELIIVLVLTLLSLFLHFWRLNEPNEIVFDETYYAKWGQDYLQGQSFFDVHPPVGKFLTGVGIALFDSDPENNVGALGWRFMSALFGALLIPLIYFIARKAMSEQRTEIRKQRLEISESRITESDGQRIAGLATLFVLIDGLLLVQTRTALLDSFLLLFGFGAIAALFAYRDAPTRHQQIFWFLIMGLLLGLTLATKWTGIGFWLLLFLFWAVYYFSGSQRPFWQLPRLPWIMSVLSFFLLPAAIYCVSFLANHRDTGFWFYLWDWHKQAWNFHHTLHATHPYESQWWSWLYLGRPVWYFFKESDGVVRGILALGNPLLWWLGIPALLMSGWTVLRRKTPALLFPLAGALGFYLPWILIGRTSFQYYTVPMVPFYFILLAWWINHLWFKPRWHPIVETLLILAVLLFLFFLPLLIGYPVSNDFYRLHLWFASWI